MCHKKHRQQLQHTKKKKKKDRSIEKDNIFLMHNLPARVFGVCSATTETCEKWFKKVFGRGLPGYYLWLSLSATPPLWLPATWPNSVNDKGGEITMERPLEDLATDDKPPEKRSKRRGWKKLAGFLHAGVCTDYAAIKVTERVSATDTSKQAH